VVDPFLSVIPYVKAGKMKMIATLGDRRVDGYDYPIAAENRPGFAVVGLLGFVAPAATPKAVVAKIQADTAKVLAVPETRKRDRGARHGRS
jgi:tripartite-type tricarboxylate transporter receptor subunit TctC